jgi:hypothetical protein
MILVEKSCRIAVSPSRVEVEGTTHRLAELGEREDTVGIRESIVVLRREVDGVVDRNREDTDALGVYTSLFRMVLEGEREETNPS